MNKLYILAGLTVLSITSVSAEGVTNDMMRGGSGKGMMISGATTQRQGRGEDGKGMMVGGSTSERQGRGGEGRGGVASGTMMRMPSTGDPIVDAQLKALNVEMETKIKAVRDEYGAKILAILKERMIKSGATSTPREMMHDGKNFPMMRESNTHATGTPREGDGMRRPEGEGRGNGKVLGDSIENRENQPQKPEDRNQPTGSLFGNFFRGMFGR